MVKRHNVIGLRGSSRIVESLRKLGLTYIQQNNGDVIVEIPAIADTPQTEIIAALGAILLQLRDHLVRTGHPLGPALDTIVKLSHPTKTSIEAIRLYMNWQTIEQQVGLPLQVNIIAHKKSVEIIIHGSKSELSVELPVYE